MRDLGVLFIHFIAVLARLVGPGGVRSLVAESLLLKHQILILNRSRKRSPNLYASDRILAGLMTLLVRPTRLLRSAIVLKPSTLLALYKAMSKGKYRMPFSPVSPPAAWLIAGIEPSYNCPTGNPKTWRGPSQLVQNCRLVTKRRATDLLEQPTSLSIWMWNAKNICRGDSQTAPVGITLLHFYRNYQNLALRQVIHFAGVRGFGEAQQQECTKKLTPTATNRLLL
jgi:hypothetical protein